MLLVALGAAVALPGAAQAATFTVNSTADTTDATPGNGICATAGGTCTLRAAAVEANALPDEDRIVVPAGTYQLGSALPLTKTVTIDGAGARARRSWTAPPERRSSASAAAARAGSRASPSRAATAGSTSSPPT